MSGEEQEFRSAVLDFEEKNGRSPTKKELQKIKELIKSNINAQKCNRRRLGTLRKKYSKND